MNKPIQPNESQAKSATYKTLDAWRGLASLCVVVFHSTAPLVERDHLGTIPMYTLTVHGALGVWIFFVISGYCIANAASQALTREQGLRLYTIARFRRIYWPCWFALAFYLASAALATILVSHGYLKSSALSGRGLLDRSLLFYLSNLTLTQVLLNQGYIADVCWTLCYEIGFYVIVGMFLAYAIKKSDEQFMLNCLHAVTIVSLLFLIVTPRHSVYPFDYWPQFGLGVLIYDLIRHPARAVTRLIFALASVQVIVLVYLCSSGFGYHGVGGRVPLLLGFGFAVLMLFLHRHDERLYRIVLFRWLSWVGLFSYSLYLIHVMVIGLVIQVKEKIRLPIHLDFLCVIASAVASVLLARVFFQFFEKPYMRYRIRSVAVPVESLPEVAPVTAKVEAPW